MSRKSRKHTDVTITITSKESIYKHHQHGRLTYERTTPDGDVMTFEEDDEQRPTMLSIEGFGDRKWIPLRINSRMGLRVTRNKVTHSVRILFTLGSERIKQLREREMFELSEVLEECLDDLRMMED